MKPAVRETELAPEDIIWAGMTYEEWAAQGPKLGKLVRGIQWVIATWIIYGEGHYGERYAQAVAETGLAEQTVLNILAVARAFPDVGRRREALSFGHHDVVAKMDPDNQDHWLDAATTGAWSVTRLRAEVRAKGTGRRALPSTPAKHCRTCSCWEVS